MLQTIQHKSDTTLKLRIRLRVVNRAFRNHDTLHSGFQSRQNAVVRVFEDQNSSSMLWNLRESSHRHKEWIRMGFAEFDFRIVTGEHLTRSGTQGDGNPLLNEMTDESLGARHRWTLLEHFDENRIVLMGIVFWSDDVVQIEFVEQPTDRLVVTFAHLSWKN
ncbi:hypothetical protein GCK72_008629 [Caenorhabditis remanei]|uniref:Uncharacterized protein n=1 Tax=Caenorhabditis remanei TaxID=31234 RepID=A0A6A5GY19_CAERE|nr:hypothetical protein GCK72_008629 [Caenorhabditis remanei]KAF1760380.1 hypothetical protein GCK72_008629 [Caenorhabditis remanei]